MSYNILLHKKLIPTHNILALEININVEKEIKNKIIK